VNCHTHLELTHLEGQNGELEFTQWIRRVRELKQATTPEQFLAAAERGIRAAWAAGVTCVADTGDSGAVIEALARVGGRGIIYHEVFGPDPAQERDSIEGLVRAISRLRRFAGPCLRLGVSPHAPYSVSAPLYRATVALARREGLPLAVHLAESQAETQLVRDGAGPFAELLRRRGIAVQAAAVSPVAYVDGLGVLGPETLCIHCVQLDARDVERLGRSGAAVAHCPLSNRAHGHGTAPYSALRAAGVRVGLGTDSVVSVGKLDLWGEAQAVGVTGEDALRLLTLEGARALGWEREIGSLESGKAADIAVFTGLPPDRPTALLAMVAGRVVQRSAANLLHKQ